MVSCSKSLWTFATLLCLATPIVAEPLVQPQSAEPNKKFLLWKRHTPDKVEASSNWLNGGKAELQLKPNSQDSGLQKVDLKVQYDTGWWGTALSASQKSEGDRTLQTKLQVSVGQGSHWKLFVSRELHSASPGWQGKLKFHW